MRNLFLASLSVVCIAGVTGCDDSGSGGTTGNLKIDLSMAAKPDLSKGPDGCNGFDMCLTTCAQQNQNDPTGYSNCANDCAANATDMAISLWVQAYFVCPGTKFCGPGHVNDAGVQPCSSADLDPNGTSVSDACNACLDDAYKNMSSAIATMCKTDISACTADKP
jgi:hypothetical protein